MTGWEAAGSAGAPAAALSLGVPFSLLLLTVGHWWHRQRNAPSRQAVERGLAPVAVGLIFAGAVTLARGDGAGWLGVATIALCTASPLRGALG